MSITDRQTERDGHICHSKTVQLKLSKVERPSIHIIGSGTGFYGSNDPTNRVKSPKEDIVLKNML